MARASIPADPFPFIRHRTLLEVERTIALRTAPRKLTASELKELSLLEAKAVRNNPPREPEAAA